MRKLTESDFAPATTKENMTLLFEKRRHYSDYLVEKWSKTDIGTKKLADLYSKDIVKARNTALILESQYKYLKTLKESGINVSQAFYNILPQNVLKIVRIGVANSNRSNIFLEYPLVSMHDTLYYIYRKRDTAMRGAPGDRVIVESDADEWRYATEIETLNLATNITTDLTNATFSGTATQLPITYGSVRIVVSLGNGKRVFIGYDGADGRIYDMFGGGIIDSSNSTVDYTTGNIVLQFQNPLTPATLPFIADFTSNTLQKTITVEYHFDSELPTHYPDFGDVKIEVRSIRFKPRPYPISFTVSQLARIAYSTTKLGDLEDDLIKAMGDELAMRRDYQALYYARTVADTNPVREFDANFAASSEDNDYNHAQRLVTAINAVSSEIYNDIKRGEVNKIVTTRIGLSYLAKLMRFESDNSQPRVGATFLAGKLSGIDVYVTPSSPLTVEDRLVSNNKYDSDMLLIYKNPQEEGEPSIAFGVLTELSAALEYPELYKKGVLATVEDAVLVQKKFIRRLIIRNNAVYGN